MKLNKYIITILLILIVTSCAAQDITHFVDRYQVVAVKLAGNTIDTPIMIIRGDTIVVSWEQPIGTQPYIDQPDPLWHGSLDTMYVIDIAEIGNETLVHQELVLTEIGYYDISVRAGLKDNLGVWSKYGSPVLVWVMEPGSVPYVPRSIGIIFN